MMKVKVSERDQNQLQMKICSWCTVKTRPSIQQSIPKMVLSKPENKHVSKAFDLRGKVAAVTGKLDWI